MERIVIVGAGLAGLRAAEALRREGHEGAVTLLGAEREPPYDRPPLSKEILLGTRDPASVALASPEALQALELDLRLETAARSLDLDRRVVETEDGAVPFDGLILACGATPRTLPLLAGLPGVHTLRTLPDALALERAFASARRLVIVGAGFIGSEVAASARARGLEVTILELEETPLARAFGVEMGAALAALHAQNGTTLLTGVTVAALPGGGIEELLLSDGTLLPADLVLVAVGVVPATAWLDGSGLELDGGVVCDAALNAGAPGVFAVGDLASWPNELFDRRMRVEHWTNAADQARHAARNLMHGLVEPFVSAGYVWSDQYDARIQFVGSSVADETVVVAGSIEESRFVAWYREGERIVGALGVGSPKLLMRSRALIESRTAWDEAVATLEGDV